MEINVSVYISVNKVLVVTKETTNNTTLKYRNVSFAKKSERYFTSHGIRTSPFKRSIAMGAATDTILRVDPPTPPPKTLYELYGGK